jgi:hypothetical protein
MINQTLNSAILNLFQVIPNRLMQRFLWLLNQNPTLGDRWGYHIRKSHFYEPLPDFSAIQEADILKRRSLSHIDWDWDRQLQLIQKLEVYSSEIQSIHAGSVRLASGHSFPFLNDAYVELDAAIYYAIIRHLKPNQIIEIGSGYSTQIASLAIAQNQQEHYPGQITCIEPYPPSYLVNEGLPIHLIQQPIELIDLSCFEQLNPGDILFIDSTHMVKFGSDVCREILDILPMLKPGVWIHIHDIFFPYDYPPKWLMQERRAWNEQYLVEAFLAYNQHFCVQLANHWLALDFPSEAARLWPTVSQ